MSQVGFYSIVQVPIHFSLGKVKIIFLGKGSVEAWGIVFSAIIDNNPGLRVICRL